jgi:hypothetical protein
MEPFFAVREPPPDLLAALPGDYIGVVREFGGREGFLGPVYLRLYRLEELAEVNLAYDVPTYFPEGVVFGSDGCGNAFAFSRGQASVLEVPFIPLLTEYGKVCAASFTEFVEQSAILRESADHNPDACGLQLYLTGISG